MVNVGKINIQDFSAAADYMTQSLIDNYIAQGRIKSSKPGEPAILAISQIVNSTGSQLDMDQLSKKIRINLNRTGEIVTTTTYKYGGGEDPLAKETQQYNEFLSGDQTPVLPDYTLSGKIIEDYSKQGNTRQSAYIFQLSLTDQRGLAVWEDERTITKQGKKSSVGW